MIGCGAVGSLFAANLALLDDVEVWAFDLNELHVAAINRDGLRLSVPVPLQTAVYRLVKAREASYSE